MGIVYESRTTELAPYFSYRLLTADHGLSSVASRYGTTLDGVLQASVKWDRTWARFAVESVEHFAHHVNAADPAAGAPPWEPRSMITLPTPRAELAWDWVLFRVDGSATLKEICDAQNVNAERVEAHMPALTPLELWKASGNRWLRNAVLKGAHHHEHGAIDRDPSTARLPADTHVWVPYPKHAAGTVIHAAPNPVRAPASGTQPNTVAVQPIPDDIIRLLREHLVPIFTQTAVLAGLNARCKAATEKGGAVLVKLTLLRQILDRYAREHMQGHILDSAGLSNLDLALIAAQDAATPVLTSPFEYVDLAGSVQRDQVAAELERKLQSPEFARLANPIAKGPDVRLNGSSVLDYISSALALGYEQVFLTKRGDHLLDSSSAALAKFTAGGGAEASPSSALHAVLAAAGGASGVATTLVGPGSLATKVFGLVLLKELPRALADASARAGKIEALTATLMKLGGLTRAEIAGIGILVRGGSSDSVKAAVDRLAQKAMTHFMGERGRDLAGLGRVSGWGWASLALNVISMLSVVESDDKITARHWSNVLGGTASAANAALQVIKQFGAQQGQFQVVVGKISGGLGTLASVASIVSGCFTIYEGISHHNDSILAGGILTTTGSVLTIAAFGIPVWGQAVGVAMVLVGSQLGGSTPLQDYVAGEAQVLLLEAVLAAGGRVLGRSPAMAHWTSEMTTSVQGLREKFVALAEAAGDAQLSSLADTPENDRFLTALGFGEEQSARLRGFTHELVDPESVSRMP